MMMMRVDGPAGVCGAPVAGPELWRRCHRLTGRASLATLHPRFGPAPAPPWLSHPSSPTASASPWEDPCAACAEAAAQSAARRARVAGTLVGPTEAAVETAEAQPLRTCGERQRAQRHLAHGTPSCHHRHRRLQPPACSPRRQENSCGREASGEGRSAAWARAHRGQAGVAPRGSPTPRRSARPPRRAWPARGGSGCWEGVRSSPRSPSRRAPLSRWPGRCVRRAWGAPEGAAGPPPSSWPRGGSAGRPRGRGLVVAAGGRGDLAAAAAPAPGRRHRCWFDGCCRCWGPWAMWNAGKWGRRRWSRWCWKLYAVAPGSA